MTWQLRARQGRPSLRRTAIQKFQTQSLLMVQELGEGCTSHADSAKPPNQVESVNAIYRLVPKDLAGPIKGGF